MGEPKRAVCAFTALLVSLTAAGPTSGADGPAWGDDLTRRDAAATIWAVGDGADGSAASTAVAELIEADAPDRFLYLGDVYENGTASDFADRYQPVYGALAAITAPTPGNHEWGNRDQGYFPYWRQAGGSPIRPWYAFRVAGWQILSLNSEAQHGAGSAQVRWLRERLRKTDVGTCRIAFWHRPRYSAGRGGDQVDVEPFWRALAGNATIVLNGHNHDMQRHLQRRGIVEFVSGAGGHELRYVDETDPRLAFAQEDVTGALRLTLGRETATHAFVSVDGTVLDSGELGCRRPD
jgi:hypothetical protein